MRTFLLIPALFLVSHVFSQKTFLQAVRIGALENEDVVESVIEVKDGFIGTGYSDQSISLYKIDFNGQLIWGKKINYGYGLSIVKTHDDGFAIAGDAGSSFDGQMCILKFDANGSLQWTKQYDEGLGSHGRKLLETDDNRFLFAGGYRYSSTTSAYLGYLIKTDSAGNLKWSKKFPNVGSFTDLKKTTDNNYILLSDKTIIKIDTAGNILWSKTFTGPISGYQYWPSILSVTNGGYLIAGYEELSGVVYGFIIRLDSLGNVLWAKLVDAGYLELNTAMETGTKDFILTGRRIDADNNYHHYFIKVNSSGTLVWTKDISGAGLVDYINDLIATSDNGYLGVATSSYNSRNFLKFSSEFNTCEPTQSLGSMKDFTVSYNNTTISNVSGNTVTYTNPVTITSAGSATNICSALPVTLVEFNAVPENKFVQLTWKTVTEANTSHFNIQRSTNGTNFFDIARITAAGNSNSAHNYAYSDLNLADVISAKTVYYRLQTVDKDGSFALSKILPVNMNGTAVTLFIRPNPARDKLSAKITNYSGNTDVRIYDVTGKQLYNNKTGVANNEDIIINTVALKAGIYLLQINTGRLILQQKFVKE
jgi:hypothetical protein